MKRLFYCIIQKIHPSGETDQFGNPIDLRRFSTSVADGEQAMSLKLKCFLNDRIKKKTISNHCKVLEGNSYIVQVHTLPKMRKGKSVSVLYKIISPTTHSLLVGNRPSQALCQEIKRKEKKKLSNHIRNIYSRNKMMYTFRGILHIKITFA